MTFSNQGHNGNDYHCDDPDEESQGADSCDLCDDETELDNHVLGRENEDNSEDCDVEATGDDDDCENVCDDEEPEVALETSAQDCASDVAELSNLIEDVSPKMTITA